MNDDDAKLGCPRDDETVCIYYIITVVILS